jgi:hypothetical protein
MTIEARAFQSKENRAAFHFGRIRHDLTELFFPTGAHDLAAGGRENFCFAPTHASFAYPSTRRTN